MRLLKKSEYQLKRTDDGPSVTISHTGLISLNGSACKLLGIKPGDAIILTCDETPDFFVAKAKKGDADAFMIRNARGGKQLSFNASAIVAEIIETKDLAIHKDKRKSIRFPLNVETIDWNNLKLHEISM